MFEESLVESSAVLGRTRPWPAIFSIVIEAVVVGTLLSLPLWHPELLPFSAPATMVLAPPPVRTPPTPPVQLNRAASTSSAIAPQAPPTLQPQIARTAFQSAAQTVDQPALPVGVNLVGEGQSPLAAMGLVGPGRATVVTAAPSPGPLHVSTGVMQGRLIEPIQPQYPAIARLSRSEGTVVVKAIISKAGTIESAHVESGPPMLQAAALDAVRRARYHPFLLNDQPTEVETTISIVFRIGT